jgi:hypothetical protein
VLQIKELEDEAELAQDKAADLNLAATVRMIGAAAAAAMATADSQSGSTTGMGSRS